MALVAVCFKAVDLLMLSQCLMLLLLFVCGFVGLCFVLVLDCSSKYPCVDLESFSTGGPTLTTFVFQIMREKGSKYNKILAIIGWRLDDGPTMNVGLVFQKFWTSVAKKLYFCDFPGGGGSGHSAPLWIGPWYPLLFNNLCVLAFMWL